MVLIFVSRRPRKHSHSSQLQCRVSRNQKFGTSRSEALSWLGRRYIVETGWTSINSNPSLASIQRYLFSTTWFVFFNRHFFFWFRLKCEQSNLFDWSASSAKLSSIIRIGSTAAVLVVNFMFYPVKISSVIKRDHAWSNLHFVKSNILIGISPMWLFLILLDIHMWRCNVNTAKVNGSCTNAAPYCAFTTPNSHEQQ